MSEHLVVDWTRCDGHGLCARLLPERVRLDDDGFPVIAPGALPAAQLRLARRAVGICPRLALRIEQRNVCAEPTLQGA